MEEKVRQAERQQNRWHLKYNQLKKDLGDAKDVVVLYENLLDELTEQNFKLKDWIKTKKVADKEKGYTRALKNVESDMNSDHHIQLDKRSIPLPKTLQNTQSHLNFGVNSHHQHQRSLYQLPSQFQSQNAEHNPPLIMSNSQAQYPATMHNTNAFQTNQSHSQLSTMRPPPAQYPNGRSQRHPTPDQTNSMRQGMIKGSHRHNSSSRNMATMSSSNPQLHFAQRSNSHHRQ